MSRILLFVMLLAMSPLWATSASASDTGPFVIVVMDPLSKPLSCECVRGYAQRDYDLLARHVGRSLNRRVKIVWFESLVEALADTGGQADLIIGKSSVVLFDAKKRNFAVRPIAQLTGQEGEVDQRGLFVVQKDDPARTLADLQGYRILMGSESHEEKSSAAELALQKAGVVLSGQRERFEACSKAASSLMRLPSKTPAAAVISSYAQPLLAGCGAIKKGDLRVVGTTASVPFVTAFIRDDADPATRQKLLESLLSTSKEPKLLQGLETLVGFVEWEKPKAVPQVTPPSASEVPEPRTSGTDWPQFRGPKRDGRVAWLPGRLPDLEKDLVWSTKLASDGIGGLMATSKMVVIGGRDTLDEKDRFIAFDLQSGRKLWKYEYSAPAELDYGNSPRATPVYAEGLVVTLGATGVLSVLEAETGESLWAHKLTKRFGAKSPEWGFCGSPLVIDDTIFLQVGTTAAIAAIDLFTGKTKWQVNGPPIAYSSLQAASNKKLLIGVDERGYFARRTSDGSAVWKFEPPNSGDFGVPSPVLTRDGLVFASENNGLTMVDSTEDSFTRGATSVFEDLTPDTHTPVSVGDLLLVAFDGLHALETTSEMKPRWTLATSDITGHASIIASADRALVTTSRGVLLLFDLNAPDGRLIDRRQLAENHVTVLSTPAITDKRLLLRVGAELRCYRLAGKASDIR